MWIFGLGKGKEVSVDPVSATMNAINAFFTFLTTPGGQNILADLRALNATIVKDIGDLVHHTSVMAQSQEPSQPKAA